ncbi:hypothetical protein SADUNF_Sadunf02G0198200 [Salix dunnii]|uniref:Embryonic stem cell-specific 5-hydroxymethylcytosine-binding protein n=1 Tax=Salix dunnii TaxID=1413687 RepID=A0A835N8W1_9ROSI|nr:hypothetical protein SADUNF_Sadunf02G0198200 [Salix dunnii]
MYFLPLNKIKQAKTERRRKTSSCNRRRELKSKQHRRKKKIRCAVERVALSEPTTSPGHATATPAPSARSIWTGTVHPTTHHRVRIWRLSVETTQAVALAPTVRKVMLSTFNARSESLSEKASFRRLIPKSRCLVAVEGFYEWKKDGSKKQPYYIHFKDGRPLVFAALYDSWKNSEGEILYTFTIVTTAASSAIQWLHDRMPVILGDKEATDTWLSVSSHSKFDTVLKPYEHSDLVWYPVTPAMGKPSVDGPECIKEIHLKMEEKGSISKFFTRKDFKEESNPEEITHGKSLKLEPNSVKEEYESDGKLETPCSAKTVDYDLKSEPQAYSHEGESKCRTKRGHEELVDSKMKTDEIVKPRSSPAKKANIKSVDDKQPTLLSYFGKK